MTFHRKDKRIMIRENMTSIFSLMPASDFIRVHKSYSVAVRHIMMIGIDQLTVNGERIPLGSSYREAVRAALKLK